MAQVFWNQINNQLPEIGEYLSGSLNVSGSFSTSGSLTINLDGVDDVFKIKVEGKEKIKVNREGVMQFISQSITPTAVAGGLFYSASNDYYFGYSN
jgi:hypothetical protein|tara:strand:- start:1339 stop:1626 length:288 start_codon:yes stop_codon:yes gene_type:complete